METKEIFGGSAKSVAEAKAKTAKKTTKKSSAKKSTAKKDFKKEIFIQYAENQVDEEAVVKKIKAALKKQKCTIKNLKMYFKPEDNACYYVANNDISGKVDLF